MVNYRNRAIDLLCAIREANNLIFKVGAPTGSDNYFRVRETLARELRKGIGDGDLSLIRNAAEAVKFKGPLAPVERDGGEELFAADVLADYILRCLS